VWNPGEHVEGYSNFLWVALLALARGLGLDVPAAAAALGAMAAAGLVLGTALLAGLLVRPTEGSSWVPPAAALLLALDADLLFWATSGLETAAYAASALFALLLFQGAKGRRGPLVAAAVLAVTAALLRPDGHLVPLVLLGIAARGLLKREIPRSHALLFAAVIVAPLAAYHAFRIWYFGDLLPNTWHARQGAPQPLVDGLTYLARALPSRAGPALLAVAALVLGRAPLGTTLVLVSALAVSAVAVGGDWMEHGRLLLPLAAPLAAAAAAGARALAGRRKYARAEAAVLLAACAILAWPRAQMGRLLALAAAPPESAQEGTMVAAQARAARWVRSRGRAGELVAANHVGAFGYAALDMRVLDMVGLTDRRIARAPGLGLHRRFDLAYVVARRPDWVILNSRRRPVAGEYPADYWPGESILARSAWFRSSCRLAHLEQWRWTVWPESWVLVYRCGEPRAPATPARSDGH
jgi:hypothetical protein